MSVNTFAGFTGSTEVKCKEQKYACNNELNEFHNDATSFFADFFGT